MQALGIWVVVEPIEALVSTRLLIAKANNGELEPVFEGKVHSVGVNIQKADAEFIRAGFAPAGFQELREGMRVLCRQVGARRVPDMDLVALDYGQIVGILGPEDDERKAAVKAAAKATELRPFTPGRPTLIVDDSRE